jgi:hypothetical protein
MRSQAIAEGLLAMFTDRARASSIVGDLAEAAREKGDAWFWWAYADVLGSAAWRPVAAFVSAAAVAWFGGRYYVGGGCFSALLNVNPASGLPAFLMRVLDNAGEFSAFIFIFAAIRFGLNDRLARLALGFAVLGIVVDWFFFVDYMSVLAAAAITILCVHALRSPMGRRSLGAIAVLWIAFMALDYVGLKTFRAGIDHVLGFRNAPAAYGAWFCFCYFGGLAIACLLCARVHRAVIGSGELVRA